MENNIKKIIEYCYSDPRTKEVKKSLIIGIDEFGNIFLSINEIIKEFARILYEEKICEKDQISQVIKYILIDKINERKISTRYIESCLPKEYKRKYNRNDIDKTAKSSHSTNNQLNNKGDSVLHLDSKEVLKENIIEQQTLRNDPKLKIKNFNKLDNNECNLCKDVYAENIELKEALQKTNKFLSAQRLKNEIKIPKEKFNDIISEINKKNPFLYIKFDMDGNILSIQSSTMVKATTTDITRNNPGN